AQQAAPQGGAASAQSAAAPAAVGTPAAAEQAASAPNADSRPGVSAAVRAAAEQALRAVQGDELRPDAATADGKAAQPQAAQPAAAEVRETLKSLLLQLSSSDTLPAGIKDAAQQAVQQLTGQQLLLNTDRTAPFAQVTMFLPFVGPDGNQTASVQIESKRGPKGELDASNCRLWFDLDMKALGRTVIDVQVVDRKVSLNFRNDEEWARPLLEAGQAEISSALHAAGYQLMALRTDALPQRTVDAVGEGNTTLSYTPQSYRGVDVKI
ncbi:DNA ligase, partial [Saccharibacillus sp. O23]